MNMIRKLFRIKVLLKERYKRSTFLKAAVVGKNVHFGQNARCINQTGHKNNLKIGDCCDIDATIALQDDAVITIGDHTTIRYDSFLRGVEKIIIGSHVIISNHVHIYDNNNHPISPKIRHNMCENGFYGNAWKWRHSSHASVIIGDDVWIGERVTILKGVTIGNGSVVGCDSVVTHDVPAYSVAAGNPACIVKKIEEN